MTFGILGVGDAVPALHRGLSTAGIECAFVASMAAAALPEGLTPINTWALDTGAPFITLDSANSTEFIDWVVGHPSDMLFVVWPEVLSAEVLSLFPRGCIGTHPTCLPYGRGRHPLHWSIVLGLDFMCMSFLILDTGIDTGDVVLRVPIEVGASPSIQELLKASWAAAEVGAETLGRCVIANNGWPRPLVSSMTQTYWPRRYPADLQLDPRMSVESLCRLQRSFSEPFDGATLVCEEGEFRIASLYLSSHDYDPDEVAHTAIGTILRTSERNLDLRVDDGVVSIELLLPLPLSLARGLRILPPAHYFR